MPSNMTVVTEAEHNEQLALEAMPLDILCKTLAMLTTKERVLSKTLKTLGDDANKVEAIVIQRMVDADTPSMTVEFTPDGERMKFSISSKTYPKMVNGSRAAAQALEAYAARLRAQGDNDTADSIEDMLTIKGQSLAPMLNEWMLNETDMPPEFEGAIEPSSKVSLSKTSAKAR